jgi:hypothetical protein
MNRHNSVLPKALRRAASRFNSAYATVKDYAHTAVVLGVSTVPSFALAQADPAGAIQGEISGIKASVGAILVVLAGVLGIMLLWSYIRRAK